MAAASAWYVCGVCGELRKLPYEPPPHALAILSGPPTMPTCCIRPCRRVSYRQADRLRSMSPARRLRWIDDGGLDRSESDL